MGSRTVTFSDRARETVGGGIAPIFDLPTTTEDVIDEESWRSEIVNTKQEASQSTQDEREELVTTRGATSDVDMVLHLENLK